MYANRVPKEQIEAHNAYTNKYLPITSICRTEEDLVNVIEQNNIDAIIVGSDALFKYVPEKNRRWFSKRKLRFIERKIMSCELFDGNPFLGGFIAKLNKKIPTVAFSVSSENCDYKAMKAHERVAIKSAMDNFSHISVRDEWTKGMVETITGKTNITVTPDPVFSFNQNCYIALPSKDELLRKYHLQDNYLLISFSTWYRDESFIRQIAVEVEKRGYQPVAFPMPEKLFAAGINATVNLPLSPIDWYALIVHSSGYIGERMHPIVVSLHNAVPFFCFDQYGIYKQRFHGLLKTYIKDSSKVYHIINQAGLTDWMYSYNGGQPLPDAKFVVDKIEHFDKEKCSNFSVSQQDRYEEGMSVVMKMFNKSI
jgi:hypothetical protein